MSVINSGFGGSNEYAQITIHADKDYSKCITLQNLGDTRQIYTKTKDVYGNVWFIGGWDSYSSYSTSVDKYLIDGTRAKYALSSAREIYKKCATYDNNGNVYVFGGWEHNGSSGSAVEVVDKFSPDGTRTTSYIDGVYGDVHALTDKNGNIWCAGNNTVVKISPSGAQTKLSMSVTRSDMESAMDGAGNIYFAGGRRGTNYFSTVDKFSTDGTRTTLQLQQGRYYLSSATDGLGNVWFAGGIYGNSSKDTSNVVEKFTPSGTKTNYTLSNGASLMSSATDKEGSVYFGSGTTLNKFTISGVRTILTTQNTISSTSQLVTDGKGYVINANCSMKYVERFDLNGNPTRINVLSKRENVTACVDGKGCVLLAGGRVNSVNTNKVEKIVRDTVLIPVPPGTIYKYPDQEENIAEEDEILSFDEGDGYIKYKKTEWEIN